MNDKEQKKENVRMQLKDLRKDLKNAFSCYIRIIIAAAR